MNKDTIEGNWKQIKGQVKARWGKLTDDDLTVAAGNTKCFAHLEALFIGVLSA